MVGGTDTLPAERVQQRTSFSPTMPISCQRCARSDLAGHVHVKRPLPRKRGIASMADLGLASACLIPRFTHTEMRTDGTFSTSTAQDLAEIYYPLTIDLERSCSVSSTSTTYLADFATPARQRTSGSLCPCGSSTRPVAASGPAPISASSRSTMRVGWSEQWPLIDSTSQAAPTIQHRQRSPISARSPISIGSERTKSAPLRACPRHRIWGYEKAAAECAGSGIPL